MKKRLAYYLDTQQWGGMELYTLLMLRHLDRSRYDPVVYFRSDNPAVVTRLRNGLRKLNVPLKPVDEHGLLLNDRGAAPDVVHDAETPARPRARSAPWKRIIGALTPPAVKLILFHVKTVRAVARGFQQETVDVIHFIHTAYPSLEIPLLASRLARIPVRISDVQTIRLDAGRFPLLRRAILRLALQGPTHVRVMSHAMMRDVRRHYLLPERKLRLVSNGVDVGRFSRLEHPVRFKTALGLPADARVVVLIGRLAPEKGHGILLDAARSLTSRHPKTRYLFVGDGPMRDELMQQVQARGLELWVRLLGFRDDIPSFLGIADLLVLPSIAVEGMPAVILEAMAAGIPVIASDIGGVREVVVDGETGKVVQPGDPAALAQALDELLSLDNAALRKIGLAGRRRVEEQFAWQRVVEQLLTMYQENGQRGARHKQ